MYEDEIYITTRKNIYCKILLFQQEENKKLLWLLKQGLLQQLHTYIYIIPQFSPKIRGLSCGHSSTRGVLAPVAEDIITEKLCEETDSSCSSFKEELDWQEDSAKESSKYYMDLRRSSLTKSFRDSIIEDDQNSQDSLSSGFHFSKKSNSEDFSFLLSSNNSKNIQQTILSQSYTPSESEFGSGELFIFIFF